MRRIPSKPFSAALKSVPRRHRDATWRHAVTALTEYLHVTRSLQFSHAEHIAANSPASLASLLAHFPFPSSASLLPASLRRFLSFRPVNEFDFFFESVGLPSRPVNAVFLSDDANLVPAVTVLVRFGFPWRKLGRLSPLFSENPNKIENSLLEIENLGFDRVIVIGICLAFPELVSNSSNSGLIEDLKGLFLGFSVEGIAEENIEICFGLCVKLRVFYDYDCGKGIGKMMGLNRDLFLGIGEEELGEKLGFFRELGMNGDELGLILSRFVGLVKIDLENSLLMPDFLLGVGLKEDELEAISVNFPFVLGENKLKNLPAILKAIDLNEFFVSAIKNNGDRILFVDFRSEVKNDDFYDEFERLKRATKGNLAEKKLEFLLGIGFGKNTITIRTLRNLNSSKEQLEDRFDSLIEAGLDHSRVCRMITSSPKLLNQNSDMLLAKIKYLRLELGYSLDYLINFPAFLCFDLENRVKPRYRILNYLKELGVLKRSFAPATVLATSEKRFIAGLIEIHPASAKLWFEVFSSKKNSFCK